jgi:hypothetical protein
VKPSLLGKALKTKGNLMKKTIIVMAIASLTGCMSIEGLNQKLIPVNQWYEQEYEATRFNQRYQFTKTNISTVRTTIVDLLPTIGMTVTSSANDIIATGYPTTMFTTEECELWKNADDEKSKELSGGLISLTCDPSEKNSNLIVTFSFKELSAGTLIVLDYELKAPKFEAYGLHAPRRPPPTASKAGSSKMWNLLNAKLPFPVRPATKEDVQ